MSSSAPLFSVIVVDYEKSVSRSEFRRKMKCLSEQTCKDFEVLVYHDGPKDVPYTEDIEGVEIHPETKFFITEDHEGDWGHSNRDRGIRAARGEWIVHTNADNSFYPNFVESLKQAAVCADKPTEIIKKKRLPIIIKSIAKRADKHFGTNFTGDYVEAGSIDIIVYPVLMRGLVPVGNGFVRRKDQAEKKGVVFGGVPVKAGNIDLMQLVMRRRVWLTEGGWSDTREESDGYLYQKFGRKYGMLSITQVLGEHW